MQGVARIVIMSGMTLGAISMFESDHSLGWIGLGTIALGGILLFVAGRKKADAAPQSG